MTKGLEEALNMPSLKAAMEKLKEFDEEGSQIEEEKLELLRTNVAEVTNIKRELAKFDFKDNETKLDEVTEKAMSAFEVLMDAGHNVPPNSAGQFLEPAMNALALAHDSEKTKIERKLRLMKLAMDQKRLEHEEQKLELMRRKMDLEERKALGETADVTETNETMLQGTQDQIIHQIRSILGGSK